jgi:hypothetical protein
LVIPGNFTTGYKLGYAREQQIGITDPIAIPATALPLNLSRPGALRETVTPLLLPVRSGQLSLDGGHDRLDVVIRVLRTISASTR